MGHQLIQQTTHIWRPILTTEGSQICDELGENTTGKDCIEIYQKTKEILHHYKNKKRHSQHTEEEQEAIKTLREDASCVILTADKGVALVVMDKSQYIDKCMTLLNDTKVYKPCRETTKKLHRDVQEALQQLNRPWYIQTIWLEQTILQQTAPHR